MKNFDFDIDDIHIHGVESGQGEPVLLLHGWGASSKFWKENIPPLAAHYRVIAFDWPGFGNSTAPPDAPYTIEWYTELLGRIMDKLRLQMVPTMLVGHSMGGAVAITFALEHPERVRSLVPVCAPIEGRTAFSWKVVALTLPVIRRFTYLISKIDWFQQRICTQYFTHSVPMDPEVVSDFGRCCFGAVILTVLSMRRLNLGPRLHEMRVPTCIITTEYDLIVHPDQLELQRAISGATFTVFPQCGHCPSVERPAVFNRDVLAFLNVK
jgi:pimeloyl-ACP methyl ester carboxylesterase